MSTTLTTSEVNPDGASSIHDSPSHEPTNDRAHGWRIVAVGLGVLAFAVVYVLGQILVLSRVQPPFTWIPGLAILAAAVFSYQLAKLKFLSWRDLDSGGLELPRVVSWVTKAMIGVAALAAGVALYVFAITSTNAADWQGEYGVVPVAALSANEFTETEQAWLDSTTVDFERYVFAIQQTEQAADVGEFETAARWTAAEVDRVADSIQSTEWLAEYSEVKPQLVTGMRIVADGYAVMAAGAAVGDEAEVERGADLADTGHADFVQPAIQFLYEN